MTEHYPNPHDKYTGGHLLDDIETSKKIQEAKAELAVALGTLAENIANITIPENIQLTLEELVSLFNWPAEQKDILPFVLTIIFSKDSNPFGKINDEGLKNGVRKINKQLNKVDLIFHHNTDNAKFKEVGKMLAMSKNPTYYFSKKVEKN